MSDADRVTLTEILKQERQKNAPGLRTDKYFEIFSAEQILKHRGFDVDHDQVRAGTIGGGDDGGIDGFFLFVNRRLVREDTDPKDFSGQQLSIELVIVQSKASRGFSEAAVSKFQDFFDLCLRLNSNRKASQKLFSQSLLDIVSKFHQMYKAALSMRPQLVVRLYGASLADELHPKVLLRRDLLLQKVHEAFSIADADLEFVGAKRLLQFFYQTPKNTIQLEAKSLLWWDQFGKAYLALVPLRKFYDFIADKGSLRDHIFESNVRDYQGDVVVNKEIRATLRAEARDEFWWLNNGITIIAAEASASTNVLSVTDPLIVNGLQTSYEIFQRFSDASIEDQRTVLVRVIEKADAESIDRIIKATNNQTKVPALWLHATEEIHRKIESVLLGVDLFYDRRKNFHRNKGVAAGKIVTLPYLAQAITALVLRRPDEARARPTTVANKKYDEIFGSQLPIQIYPQCAQVLKRVEAVLDSQLTDVTHALNVLFYVAHHATCTHLKTSEPSVDQIAETDFSQMSDAEIRASLKWVDQKFRGLGGDDKAAKGPRLLRTINRSLKLNYRSKPPAKKHQVKKR